MEDNKFLEFIGEYFNVNEYEDYIELETWTDGGVHMLRSIYKNSETSYFEQFREYVLNFDVDEEIDVHRQDERYKSDFTIRESVRDFEDYEKWLRSILPK